MSSQPNPEQRAALFRYAALRGRDWKQKLSDAWMGDDLSPAGEDGVLLRQVRNQFGPTWLRTFRVGKKMYPALSENENKVLQHISMHGMSGYPIRRFKTGKWYVDRMYGVGGFPDCFDTRAAAIERFELYMTGLRDRAAGRR